jgi:hypothetical protein
MDNYGATSLLCKRVSVLLQLVVHVGMHHVRLLAPIVLKVSISLLSSKNVCAFAADGVALHDNNRLVMNLVDPWNVFSGIGVLQMKPLNTKENPPPTFPPSHPIVHTSAHLLSSR